MEEYGDEEVQGGWRVSGREQALLEAIDQLWDRIGCPELSEALGPYELEQQSSPELELQPAWSCPFCGEEGGEPRTISSSEWYGADADGNRGEWREFSEEMCTKCCGRNR